MTNNKIKDILQNTRLTLLEYCITIAGLCLILIVIFYPVNYTKFSCTRYPDNNVVCQKKARIVYGLINHSTITFPLRGVNIKEEKKYICAGKVDSQYGYTSSYNGCRNSASFPFKTIYIYKMYLQGEQQSFFLEKKASEAYLQSVRKTRNLIKQSIASFFRGE